MTETATEATAPPPVRRRRKGRLGALHALWAVFVFAFAAVAILSLSGIPLRLPDPATRRIEEAINARLEGAGLEIGRVEMRFAPDGRPEVTLGNVGITDGAGTPLAQLNELTTGLSPTALLEGRLEPREVRLSGAQVTLRRTVEGGISVAFGGVGGMGGAARPGEAVSLVDGVFTRGVFGSIERIEATDITITLEDARTGRVWQATGGTLGIANEGDTVAISIVTEVFNGTEDLAEVEIDYRSRRGSEAASLSARFRNADAADIGLQSPALALVGLVDAPISGSMDAVIGEDGRLARLAAALDIGKGRLRASPEAQPFEFEGARVRVDYDPATGRIEVSEAFARTELVSVAGAGHLLLGTLRNGWPEDVVAQFGATSLEVAAGGVFEAPLVFDRAFADLRVTLDPFALDIGDLVLEGPHGRQEAWGRVAAEREGWRLALDIAAPGETPLADALALWPLRLAPPVREWVATNVLAGTGRAFTAAVRREPGARPETAMSFAFEDATVRALRFLPPAEGVAGEASLFDARFALGVERGTVAPPGGAPVDLAGTAFVVPNTRMRPRPAEVAVAAEGPLASVLRLLDNPPFNVLDRAQRPEALLGVDAAAEVAGVVRFPLRRGLTPPEVDYTVGGVLTGVRSADIVPGRPLAADRLEVEVTPARLEVAGPMDVGGLPLDATFRLPLEAGRAGTAEVAARLALTPATLATLGVALPPGTTSGAAEAELALSLPHDAPMGFRLTSDLVGAAIDVAPLGWSKSAATPGALEVEGEIAEGRTEVRRLALSAPGLAATGRIEPGDGPGRSAVRLDRVVAGSWLDAPVTIAGQGPGRPPAVAIEGGTVNLARKPPSRSGARMGPVPLRVALDRLAISEGLALAPFRGEMTAEGALSGSFEAQVNGGAAVRGALAPSGDGTLVRVSASDGGAVLRDAGLYRNARGGDFSLTLTPTGPGRYDGQLSIGRTRIADAPGLASLLDAISVVGLLDELDGAGILFDTIDARFELSPDRVILREGAAVGASLGISMDGVYDIAGKRMDMQGVVSPVYLLNGIGQILTRPGEGLFGFAYRMVGAQGQTRVEVNPLSIFTPGMFREIFRRPLPAATQQLR